MQNHYPEVEILKVVKIFCGFVDSEFVKICHEQVIGHCFTSVIFHDLEAINRF